MGPIKEVKSGIGRGSGHKTQYHEYIGCHEWAQVTETEGSMGKGYVKNLNFSWVFEVFRKMESS